jgi:hypothetical protein
MISPFLLLVIFIYVGTYILSAISYIYLEDMFPRLRRDDSPVGRIVSIGLIVGTIIIFVILNLTGAEYWRSNDYYDHRAVVVSLIAGKT